MISTDTIEQSGKWRGITLAIISEVLLADRIGRRSSLVLLALLGSAGGFLAAVASSPVIMIAASFVGLLNGMGRDRGPSFVLEQAILPETVTNEKRTFTFAWYNLLQDIGHALGAVLAGLPTFLRGIARTSEIISFRFSICIYAVLMLFCIPFYLKLSPHIEVAKKSGGGTISPQGKRIVWKIASIFALDSFSGGFLATALLALFFYRRFGVGESVIGALYRVLRDADLLKHRPVTFSITSMSLTKQLPCRHAHRVYGSEIPGITPNTYT